MKKQTSQQKAKQIGDQEFKTRSQNWIATQIYFDIRSISLISFCYLFHVIYHYLFLERNVFNFSNNIQHTVYVYLASYGEPK